MEQKKHTKISLKMSHKHLLGDLRFFRQKGEKKVQGIYIFDITDLFIFFTRCNVHDPECNIHDSVLSSDKEGTHHKRKYLSLCNCSITIYLKNNVICF